MDALDRINGALDLAIRSAETGSPPKLAAALRYAIFPGGARLRPRLALAVAWACGDPDPQIADGAAAAIELLHCASLIHDDLPCFDNADMRRGKPTIHRIHGEQIAVLTGDALIVLAFETLALRAGRRPRRLGALTTIIARASGAPGGISAGQAWECEEQIDLSRYHSAKTGSLFSAATMAGAAAAGVAATDWRELGGLIGEAYQVADDIRDVVCTEAQLGKPVGRDVALSRPSACRELGVRGAIDRLDSLIARAVASIPDCPRATQLRALIRHEAGRFLPEDIARMAA